MTALATAPLSYDPEVERIEISLLLEGIYRHYGFDFRSYAYSSIRRRVWRRIQAEGLPSVSALQDRVLHERQTMERLLNDLSVNVTSMFRDPDFYVAFREQVVPLLRTYPFVRVWHAGCATGEEAYSMAILLTEEGLYERARIYATDMNELALQRAKAGIFPLDRMQDYTQNYLRAGGTRSFSEYYTARYDGALLARSLMSNIVFSQHNLVTDHSFAEFHVVLCRNVLIYFDSSLQARVHGLLFESLTTLGVLALGGKESLRLSPYESCYGTLDSSAKLYRKVLTTCPIPSS
jgi:chemotaxis protein methyltransferase CheR